MSSQHSLLLTGATGFVGGTILSQLQSSHKSVCNLNITALVRKPSQASTLEQHGVRTVVVEGGLDDSQGLITLASRFDIVLHAATGFHTSSAEALITGLAERKANTGREVLYIHLSGTSNLSVGDITGLGGERRTFSDKDQGIYEYEAAIDARQPYAQRTTNIKVIETGERLRIRTYIIMPPLVWGTGTGHFNKVSQQIPSMIRNAIKEGRMEYVAPGTSRIGHVHVADLALLFESVLAKVVTDSEEPASREGYFFANTGSHTWIEIADEIAQIGHELGVLKSRKAIPLELKVAADKFWDGDEKRMERTLASTSSTKAERGYEIGWRPEREAQWGGCVKGDWEMILREKAEGK